MILFLIQHIDPCIQETGSMGQRTVKTCIERGWIKMQEQRGAREKGLYSITQAGKKHLYELINEYFQGETVQNMVSVLDTYAAGRTNMELSPHKEAEIAAALKMVLSDYREKWTQLEFEVPYSVEMMREYSGQAKKRGDIFADLKLSYRCTDHLEERPLCIEIDMGTERVSTHGGLLFKCNAYAQVNRRMRQISLHQAINVVFVFSNDPADDLQQTDLLKFESIKRYQQPLLPFLSFICRQQDPDASVTLKKMEQALGKVKECDAFGYEKKQFYRDAEFFLHVLKEQCSNQEQAGEKEILACMTEISDFCRNHLETSRTEYSRQYALKKRMDLFEQIRKNNSYALEGVRNGMSLSCNSHQDFEQEIPFLFPELYFRDQFGVFLYHLGITRENVKVSSVYAIPLFEEQDVAEIGTVYRCVFMVGELTVLIENLSSDMGGLIRARDYVRLPPAASLHIVSRQGPVQTMPLLYRPPDEYVMIAEAALYDYSGMRLRAEPGASLRADFTEQEGFELSGDIVTPWRVTIIARDLDALVNTDIITSLNPAPDPELFADTSWIVPGRSLWSWWSGIDGGFMTLEGEKRVIDTAASLGIEYSTVDDGWEERPDKWKFLHELAGYAQSRGVGLFVWRHWEKLNDPADDYRQMRGFLDSVAAVGIKGVKVDWT